MAATANVEVAVIGGGAAGLAAAISARRADKPVIICERMPRLGKKVLASGNGRCNLLNESLSEEFYNPAARPLVKSVFSRFGKAAILDFFNGLGLRTYSEAGRIFPVSNQSSSVLRVLEIELERLSIMTEFNFHAFDISDNGKGFLIADKSGRKISCRTVIIAGGGMTYPALGSDGSCYKIAERFGHTIVLPVPTAVALTAKDPLCHILQGQKIFAHAKGLVEGRVYVKAGGEVLFTKYGLSGTAILDVSREISIALNRLRTGRVSIILDMVPFMAGEALKTELGRRIKDGISSHDLIAGILPNKFGAALVKLLGMKDASSIAKNLKAREFIITGTRGWNEADFTAGGIDTAEVTAPGLESKLKKGLYFAGEILDVDGCRGGYNLAWAWASGYMAGAAAAGNGL
ncbi:MAG: aminoacetone oxidase family FAD-binding enzyme [Candidatus Omnitrophota bacterium]